MIQPIRVMPRWTSTNESGPACLTALHCEGDDNEDGGAVAEVTGTLEERKENIGVKSVLLGEVEVVGQGLGHILRNNWDYLWAAVNTTKLEQRKRMSAAQRQHSR